MKTKIEQKLAQRFSPTFLDLVDESHLHAGHAGVREKGGSHFALTLVSDVFEGVPRVQRQRAVYDALADEMKNENRDGIHALSMRLFTVGEWGKR